MEMIARNAGERFITDAVVVNGRVAERAPMHRSRKPESLYGDREFESHPSANREVRKN